MSFDIKQPSYIALRNVIAERTNRIIAWTGSGLSVQAGLPTWSELKFSLLKVGEEKIKTVDPLDGNKIYKQIEVIRKTDNLWESFNRLKSFLGLTTYRDSIRESLKDTFSASIPKAYTYLWSLRISGLLNLNIDRIAARALIACYPDKIPSEFNGIKIGEYTHVLKSPQPFIANLHGNIDDYRSWIFTQSDLRKITKDKAYQTFISNCIASNTILFIGIGADDIAVGGHLEKLTNLNIDFGTHYWITSRCDKITDDWAEKIGIRVIRYNSQGNNHSALNEFFDDLQNYIPKDEIAHPINPKFSQIVKSNLPSPNELLKSDSDTIRLILNSKAKEILSDNVSNCYEIYDDFCKKYDEAIYRAWYTSDKDGNNKLLGYTLKKLKAKGAFGLVYLAKDNNNNDVAIKVLIEDERRRTDFLQCFRRGVRSMRILAKHNIEGMVAYKEAAEIPAFVVMDWINGPNLFDVVKAKQLNEWNFILKVSIELASIIESAHHLPERVLHRDLRPPNIMLRDFYSDPENWHVVVLDFDLSWHLGATEKSIFLGSSATGYLAPEQLRKITNVSTRHSSVDSFGFGMALYFIISGRDPYPAEHMHKNWESNVTESVNQLECKNWKSIQARFSRLIINATKDKQSDRWDFGQIRGELERLEEAYQDSSKIESAEFFAEEIISRSNYNNSYNWNQDKLTANISLASGFSIKLIGDESEKKVKLIISWIDMGSGANRNTSKWLLKTSSRIKENLKCMGWVIENISTAGQVLNIRAFIFVKKLKGNNLQKIVSSINNISDSFRLY